MLQSPHSPFRHRPSLGLFPVQTRESAPEQLLPPQPGDGKLHVRVCVPLAPQAVAEHLLQADQPPFLGLLPVQDCEAAPEQLLPPQPGDGKLHVRVCVPLAPQALAEQLLQADQPPGLGSLPVQEREDAPAQALPPQPGDGWVQARVCVPRKPQALAEQALHADQPPSTGSFAVQERDDGPLQALPPQPGDGLSQVRVWVPVAPQLAAEQLPHADQPPSTGALPVQARVSLVPRVASSFRHSWPPWGDGLSQWRVCVPPLPQAVAEQALQSDQPPSTAMNLRHFSEFSPPCRPSQRHRYAFELSGIAPSLAVPAAQPLRTLSSHTPSTGTSSTRMKHLLEFRPPCSPSQRQRYPVALSANAASLGVPAEQPLRTLSLHAPSTGTNLLHLPEFPPPCAPSQRHA